MPPYTQVGKYILKKRIGEGAFAEVRLAVHEDTREEFAVKVFNRESLPTAHFERDIKKEIKIMQHLKHPNIVEIYAVLVTDKKLYLVMELVRGGELYDEIVSKRRVDEATSRRYFQQIVDAMVYCHRRGVVHRDLKPENLLLDGNGNVKITDFGMSWMKDSIDPALKAKQLLRTQCGTPKYMPPEVIIRPAEGYDGEKLDAWECGMVLYALLAGYLPFAGEDDNTVFRSILNGQVKFPRHFSPGAKDLLSRLLVKDPIQRSSLADIREHFWFLVNYHGDAVLARQRVLKSANLKSIDEHASENKEDDDPDKENRAPTRSQGAETGTASVQLQAARKMEVPLPPKPSADIHVNCRGPSKNQTESMPLSPLTQTVRDAKTLASSSAGVSNVALHAKQTNDAEPVKTAGPVSNVSQNARPDVVRQRTSKVHIGSLQSPRTPSRRGSGHLKLRAFSPLKAPPLVPHLSGAREAGEDVSPLSFRDRLRSPIASVLKSLKSGGLPGSGARDANEAEEKEKATTWFEPSPTSVAAPASAPAEQPKKKSRFSQSFSSSEEELTLLPDDYPAPDGMTSPTAGLRKMTKMVFQKKA